MVKELNSFNDEVYHTFVNMIISPESKGFVESFYSGFKTTRVLLPCKG